MIKLTKTEWYIVISLLLLSFVPSLGGTLRVIKVSANSSFLPSNPRLEENPTPIMIHVICSVLFCILGIFQFITSLRITYPRSHKISGRIFAFSGIFAAITGLWMTHFYAFSKALQGELLYVVRWIVGLSTILFILLGLKCAIDKKINHHSVWMIRAYALGQGAGMQTLTGILWTIFSEEPSGFTRDLLMVSSWIINIVFAEFVINRRRRKNLKIST